MRPMTLLAPVFALPVALLLLAGCAKKEVTPVAAYNALGRIDFNKRAAEQLLPLFWSEDTNNDGTLQPGELAVLWGLPDADASLWVANGAFTPKFVDAYARLGKPAAAGTGAEGERLRLVRDELAQGVVTLVHTDLASDPTLVVKKGPAGFLREEGDLQFMAVCVVMTWVISRYSSRCASLKSKSFCVDRKSVV